MNIIDLSHEIHDKMPVYPGDTETGLKQVRFLDNDHYNNHILDINMHAGTHIDSPMHLTDCSKYISESPPGSFIGEGCVLDVKGQSIIGYKVEYNAMVRENSIVLLYTGFDDHYGEKEYYENHPCLDIRFCEFLVKKKVKMVGIDAPSPDKYPFEVHKMLFRNNIYILENLMNLGQLIDKERFEVIALPLKIKADSSITRAVARIL